MAEDVTGIAGSAGGGASGAAILRLAAASGALALAVTIVGGEWLGWKWTGFADNNTVWDWLHLLLVPFVLPVVLAWFSASIERVEEDARERGVSSETRAAAG